MLGQSVAVGSQAESRNRDQSPLSPSNPTCDTVPSSLTPHTPGLTDIKAPSLSFFQSYLWHSTQPTNPHTPGLTDIKALSLFQSYLWPSTLPTNPHTCCYRDQSPLSPHPPPHTHLLLQGSKPPLNPPPPPHFQSHLWPSTLPTTPTLSPTHTHTHLVLQGSKPPLNPPPPPHFQSHLWPSTLPTTPTLSPTHTHTHLVLQGSKPPLHPSPPPSLFQSYLWPNTLPTNPPHTCCYRDQNPLSPHPPPPLQSYLWPSTLPTNPPHTWCYRDQSLLSPSNPTFDPAPSPLTAHPPLSPSLVLQGQRQDWLTLMPLYCDWVRQQVGCEASGSVWQHTHLSQHSCPWDTRTYFCDVKQPSNKWTKHIHKLFVVQVYADWPIIKQTYTNDLQYKHMHTELVSVFLKHTISETVYNHTT